MKLSSYFSLFPFFIILTLLTARQADDPFNWQTLESGALKVHWYQSDATFGQAALETAQAGLKSIARLVPPNLEQPVEIFIYASANDLQSVLASSSENWIAGHADPVLGIIRVVIEPGAEQKITMEQRIPHELMHVMLYRSVGAGYNNIPAWLREGTATFVEIYPNADYDRVLAEAVTNHGLIPLQDLCISFPTDAGQAFLAYAESRSFTDYLYDSYGATGLENLARTYADGVDCEHGTERAFGVSLSNLEARWRSSALRENTLLAALQNISPFLVLLCLVLIIPLIGVVSSLRKRGSSDESGTYSRK